MTTRQSATIRQPAVAGSFYPGDKHQLQGLIEEYLENKDHLQHETNIKALIVPHAGYIYSGPIAASAYRLLKNRCGHIRRVVLLGPSHRIALRGIAVPSDDAFHTPLGDIPLDKAGIALMLTQPQVKILDQAHAYEHSLEVQLPFLQSVLTEFCLLPIVVGAIDAEAVAALLRLVLNDENTLIVISSDLSHYHPYQQACAIDQHTSEQIEAKNWHLQGEQACGAYPLNGLLKLAAEKSWSINTLDQRNSGDTAGDKDRVVGYGAYVVYQQ